MPKTLIVIVGPTAAGKTDLAIAVAKKFRTEIISADSRQVYRELNIGVARPSEMQLSEVAHHFVANKSVKEEYAAGKFEKDALACLNQIFKKHDVAVMVGGSGLYVKAVCEGMDAVPTGAPEIREQIENELRVNGLKHLQDELKKADPVYYKSADVKNPRRVMRALEVFRASGKPFSSFHKKEKTKRDFHIVKIGISPEREKLYERINLRVDEMMQHGLLKEVENLRSFKNINALQTVGYKELFDYLDGKTDLETAINLIRQNTRNYAKRQLTWFRKDKDVKWFDTEGQDKAVEWLRLAIAES